MSRQVKNGITGNYFSTRVNRRPTLVTGNVLIMPRVRFEPKKGRFHFCEELAHKENLCLLISAFAATPFINPSNAEATFHQSTRTQKTLKTIQNLSCWYLLEGSLWVPMCQGFNHFSVLLQRLELAKLATSSIRVKALWVQIKIFPTCLMPNQIPDWSCLTFL